MTPFNLIFAAGFGVCLFLKKITSVLVAFSDILFARSQWLSDLRSLFKFLVGFLFLFFVLSMVYSKLVSSAKCLVVEYLIQVFKSFMYTRKSNGLSAEPWGTPCSKN